MRQLICSKLRAEKHYWFVVLFANKDKVLQLGFSILLALLFMKNIIDFKDNN